MIAPIADCGSKDGCINSMMYGVFRVFNRRSTVPIFTRLSQMARQKAQHGYVCEVGNIDMSNSIEREQQSHVVSRPMSHASHECNVCAKDERLYYAIFGLWERR